MNNLSLHEPYEGPDDIIIGDVQVFKSHTLANLQSLLIQIIFFLDDVLCSPNMQQNLISVCQFCKTNHTSADHWFLVLNLQIFEE